MATIFDEKTILKRISEGRGTGEYENYKPWLTVRDVPSPQSRSNRPLGWKTQREHHLLSDLEYYYFLFLEWHDNILDIREQYPLDREETIKIANETGLRHPYMHDTYQVMSTDFLVLLKDGSYAARTVKEAKNLENENVIVKFSIEQIYWQRKGISWGIATRNEIDDIYAKNLEILHPAKYALEEYNNTQVINYIIKHLSTSKSTVDAILEETDEVFGLEIGTALLIYKSLIANKIVSIDMFQKFNIGISADEVSIILDVKEKMA
jgi:hypothetical protein